MVAEPDPLWETVLSLHQLQDRDAPPVFRRWQRTVLAQAKRTAQTGTIRLLVTINPAAAYFPDFLTPTPVGAGLDTALDTVLSTPRSRLRAEFALLAGNRPLPSWLRSLADGEPAMLRRLGGALRTYHRQVLAPHACQIRRDFDAHRRAASRAMLDAGYDGLLAGLGPVVRWCPPVLEADFPQDRTIRLDGRGITLVPSYFCWRTATTLADGDLAPVLVYPIRRSTPWLGTAAGAADGTDTLAALLGPTRAAVLEVLAVPHTTLSLAKHVGIAPATASHHTTVLRDAGLITTDRSANTALHSLTDLGRELTGQ